MQSSVKKRNIFYISGYDPRGARHYYHLYKKEANKQSQTTQMKLNISPRKRNLAHVQSWKIHSQTNHHQTETTYHFLEWDDIIRDNWKKSIFTLYRDLLYVMYIYLFSGHIFKYAKHSPRQMIAAFYPVVYLLLTFVMAYYFYTFTLNLLISVGLYIPLAFLVALIAPYSMMKLSLYLGDKIAVFWLLRVYTFAAHYVNDSIPLLNERMRLFAHYIAEAINHSEQTKTDEILIVSHSVGTILSVPILAKALHEVNVSLEKVSIVTLGECIPLVSYLKKATEYREQMHTIAQQRPFWLDYTSPIDGACFPLLDFYTHSDVNVDYKPLFLSPRFHTLFSNEAYAKLRKNRYITHFIYLMAMQHTGEYDFFKITAGPFYLQETLKGRKQ
jgi:hypothetical protein